MAARELVTSAFSTKPNLGLGAIGWTGGSVTPWMVFEERERVGRGEGVRWWWSAALSLSVGARGPLSARGAQALTPPSLPASKCASPRPTTSPPLLTLGATGLDGDASARADTRRAGAAAVRGLCVCEKRACESARISGGEGKSVRTRARAAAWPAFAAKVAHWCFVMPHG